MKTLNIFFIIIFFSFIGCSKEKTPYSKLECNFHSDCENDLICINNQCKIDLCKTDYCKNGVCSYEMGTLEPDDFVGGIKCECSENSYFQILYVSPDNVRRKDPRFCETYPELCNDAKYDEDVVVDYICHSQQEKQCSSSLECYNLFTFNCDSTTGTCGFGCFNDNQCMGKDELCDRENYACYSVSIFTCEDGQYFSAVEQKCIAKCSQNSDCSEPVAHCNEVSGVCVSNCTTNEDCTGFKWSGGSVCNSNGFCE